MAFVKQILDDNSNYTTSSNLPASAYNVRFRTELNDYGSASFNITGKAMASEITNKLGSCFNIKIADKIVFVFVWEDISFVWKDSDYEYTISGRGLAALWDTCILWPQQAFVRLDGSNGTFTYPGLKPYSITDSRIMGVYRKSFSIPDPAETKNNPLPEYTTDPVPMSHIDKYDDGTYSVTDYKTVAEVAAYLYSQANFRGAYQPSINYHGTFTPFSDRLSFSMGTKYSSIFFDEFARNGMCFIRQDATEMGIYTPDSYDFNAVAISGNDMKKVYNVTGRKTIKDTYTAYLVIDRDVVTSYRPNAVSKREGVKTMAISMNPNVQAQIASGFANNVTGNITIEMNMTGTGIDPITSFNVGDTLTYSDVVSDGRVVAIEVNLDSNSKYPQATIELSNNISNKVLPDLPAIIRNQKKIEEALLQSLITHKPHEDIKGISIQNNGTQIIINNANNRKDYIDITKDAGTGKVVSFTDKLGNVIPISWEV